jgi:hypothetical protein
VSDRAEDSRLGVWWNVALEATLFFSLPTWLWTVDPAWPTNNPIRFAVILAVGALGAMILCHVAPAFWSRELSFGDHRFRVLRLLAGVWCCAGAAVLFGKVAGAMWLVFWYWYPDVTWGSKLLIVGFATIVAVVGWGNIRAQRIAILVFLAMSVGLVLIMFTLQLPGLHTRNAQLNSEAALDDPAQMLVGFFIAAAPASVLAARIGRSGVRSRTIWRTGLVGIWLPLVASVTLVSLAKIGGMRLYWKPSVPIEFIFAMVANPVTWPVRVRWTLAVLTAFSPALIAAFWTRDALEKYVWRWKRPAAIVALAAIAFVLSFFPESLTLNGTYYETWCWTIVAMNGVLALACLFRKRRPI